MCGVGVCVFRTTHLSEPLVCTVPVPSSPAASRLGARARVRAKKIGQRPSSISSTTPILVRRVGNTNEHLCAGDIPSGCESQGSPPIPIHHYAAHAGGPFAPCLGFFLRLDVHGAGQDLACEMAPSPLKRVDFLCQAVNHSAGRYGQETVEARLWHGLPHCAAFLGPSSSYCRVIRLPKRKLGSGPELAPTEFASWHRPCCSTATPPRPRFTSLLKITVYDAMSDVSQR